MGVLGEVYRDVEAKFEDYDEAPDEGIAACVQLANSERQLELPSARQLQSRKPKPLTVAGFGMQLHAATTVDGADKAALERICRYLLRPAFAQDAVEALGDGRVRIHFKGPTFGGRMYTDISRDTFIARLAALVPPPRFNLVRYYGVFASQHRLRAAAAPKEKEPEVRQLKLFELRPWLDGRDLDGVGFVKRSGAAQARRAPGRIAWAKLLARVFEVDVTKCGRCGGRLRLVETVSSHKQLTELQAARGPPRLRPAVVGQLQLFGQR